MKESPLKLLPVILLTNNLLVPSKGEFNISPIKSRQSRASFHTGLQLLLHVLLLLLLLLLPFLGELSTMTNMSIFKKDSPIFKRIDIENAIILLFVLKPLCQSLC